MRLRSTVVPFAVLLGLMATLPILAQLPTGRDFRVRDGDVGRQFAPRAAAAPDGRFAVVWVSEIDLPQEGDVMVRLFDPLGRPRGAEFAVALNDVKRQAFPAVAMAPNGAFVVTWIMGLGGYRRSSLRLFWHVNEIVRDTSPWAYTHTVGFATNLISFNALIFWGSFATFLWLVRAAKASSDEQKVYWSHT